MNSLFFENVSVETSINGNSHNFSRKLSSSRFSVSYWSSRLNWKILVLVSKHEIERKNSRLVWSHLVSSGVTTKVARSGRGNPTRPSLASVGNFISNSPLSNFNGWKVLKDYQAVGDTKRQNFLVGRLSHAKTFRRALIFFATYMPQKCAVNCFRDKHVKTGNVLVCP